MDFETFSATWDDIEDIPTEENHEEVSSNIRTISYLKVDNPTAPIQLINAKSNPLQTLHLEYTDDLPEYPRSDINGYSYVVAVNNRSQEEAESLVQDPSLRTLYHTSLDEVAWAEIQNILFTVHKKLFFKKDMLVLKHCLPAHPSSSVISIHLKDVNGDHHPYIGCVNASSSFLQKHYYTSVKGYTSMDLEFLEQLFNESILPSQEECGVIEPLTSRRKYCVFTSHGIHQHPPPPPHKPPELILRGVERIIKQMRNPSLTLAQFLRSPELEALCQQYNASTPAEIHASFSNTDRISAIIQKQRLLSYPAGQSFNGVIYLYNTNPFIKVTIL
ncbi:hypothetical protein GB937_010062 [Aspergillus fischeri]|nr:hypothetical protein GB937_010062 [Aspergillus fischeri]